MPNLERYSINFCSQMVKTLSVIPLKHFGNVLFAAAAKSLQSCPTLCDPRDGSPPGSSVPGILQARVLEWVAVSFSICCLILPLFTSHRLCLCDVLHLLSYGLHKKSLNRPVSLTVTSHHTANLIIKVKKYDISLPF